MVHLLPALQVVLQVSEYLRLGPILSVFTIFFALMVSLIPILYPGYYSNQAEKGIDKLDDQSALKVIPVNNGETIHYTRLTRGNTGFNQINNAIDKYGHEQNMWFSGLSGDINEIRYYIGSTSDFASYFQDDSMQYGQSTNYLLSVTYPSGAEEVVFYRPWQPRSGRNHGDLRSCVSEISKRRSQIATSGIAVLWTTAAVANLVI